MDRKLVRGTYLLERAEIGTSQNIEINKEGQ